MKLQVLISTMYQSNHRIVKKMNIQSDAIVINQCNKNQFEEFDYKGNNIKFLSFAERGVGLSRNNALMRATADICLIADDDVIYVNNYPEIILRAFQECPQADILVFNINSKDDVRRRYMNSDYKKLNRFNIFRYGAVRLAVRIDSIRKSNIFFSLLFGGGARYSSGEDSLFLFECIKKDLNIYACPYVIGQTDDYSSTWFRGYTEKYFLDKGAFYSTISKKFARFFCFQDAFRHKRLYNKQKNWFEAYNVMCTGIKKYNQK